MVRIGPYNWNRNSSTRPNRQRFLLCPRRVFVTRSLLFLIRRCLTGVVGGLRQSLIIPCGGARSNQLRNLVESFLHCLSRSGFAVVVRDILCARLQQLLHIRLEANVCRVMQRSAAVFICDVGALFALGVGEQQLQHLEVLFRSRDVHRGQPTRVLKLCVRAVLEENFDDFWLREARGDLDGKDLLRRGLGVDHLFALRKDSHHRRDIAQLAAGEQSRITYDRLRHGVRVRDSAGVSREQGL
mmetsp:Transcript_38953/g.96775  ORF Transcript_38953/g.96775 Transcript_38953/m.96775 type:complete len:242 (-) Transcript_38953:53-778(-)